VSQAIHSAHEEKQAMKAAMAKAKAGQVSEGTASNWSMHAVTVDAARNPCCKAFSASADSLSYAPRVPAFRLIVLREHSLFCMTYVNLPAAIKDLEAALEHFPHNARLLTSAAVLHGRRNNVKRARELFSRGREADPDSAVLLRVGSLGTHHAGNSSADVQQPGTKCVQAIRSHEG
jgi:hypothetical protein